MPTLLVVDDNRPIREYCKTELERLGYRVLVAEDGFHAPQLIRDIRPDLVVLDIRMSRVNGLEAFAAIRAADAEMPVIFLYCAS